MAMTGGPAPAGTGSADNQAVAVFERLKSLAGEWYGERPDGRRIGVSYRLSAGGTVLVETWQLGPQQEALTIYHLDGDQLMASHFCPQGNQPRLKLRAVEGARYDFEFHDATGLRQGQSVQQDFWIEIGTDGKLTRGETYVEDGAEESETITYERVKD